MFNFNTCKLVEITFFLQTLPNPVYLLLIANVIIRIKSLENFLHKKALGKAMQFYEYREYLYRERTHPKPDENVWVDRRDSFLALYLSLIPFVMFEYLIELQTELPSGLIFPLAYLLFWAYYYTYYKPTELEECLSKPKGINLSSMFTLILGVAIWFVKTTFVKLVDFLFRFLLKPIPQKTNLKTKHRTVTIKLPADILEALKTLGLSERSSWQEIHTRYRELAKRYHPDLHPEITKSGNRFMMYDTAYKKLLIFRAQKNR